MSLAVAGCLVSGFVPVNTSIFHLGTFLHHPVRGLGDLDAVTVVKPERDESAGDEWAEGLQISLGHASYHRQATRPPSKGPRPATLPDASPPWGHRLSFGNSYVRAGIT